MYFWKGFFVEYPVLENHRIVYGLGSVFILKSLP